MKGGGVGHVCFICDVSETFNLMKQMGGIGSFFKNLPPLAALKVRTHGVVAYVVFVFEVAVLVVM